MGKKDFAEPSLRIFSGLLLTKFLNANLKLEYYSRMKVAGFDRPEFPLIQVGNIPAMKALSKKSQGETAKRQWTNCADFQSDLNEMIPAETVRKLLVNALFETDNTPNLSDLKRIMFAASFTAAACDLRRGDEHYKQRVVQRFTIRVKEIGPRATDVGGFITNEAKHNTSGKYDYILFGPHADPFMSTSSWHGMLWIHRLFVLQEKWPSLFDFQEFYKLPTYTTDVTGEMISPAAYYQLWKAHFDKEKLQINKVTHCWRVQRQQEMDAHPAAKDGHIKRHVGSKEKSPAHSKSQEASYLRRTPIPTGKPNVVPCTLFSNTRSLQVNYGWHLSLQWRQHKVRKMRFKRSTRPVFVIVCVANSAN